MVIIGLTSYLYLVKDLDEMFDRIGRKGQVSQLFDYFIFISYR